MKTVENDPNRMPKLMPFLASAITAINYYYDDAILLLATCYYRLESPSVQL